VLFHLIAIDMSKKWNLFRKKGSKADSHGTTSAHEEIFFQPVPAAENESPWPTSSGATRNQGQQLDEPSEQATRKLHLKNAVAVLPPISAHQMANSLSAKLVVSKNAISNTHENGETRPRTDSISGIINSHNVGKPYPLLSTNSDIALTEPVIRQYIADSEPLHVVPAATVIRASPLAPRKLVKPGDTNLSQPVYLQPTSNNNESVSLNNLIMGFPKLQAISSIISYIYPLCGDIILYTECCK